MPRRPSFYLLLLLLLALVGLVYYMNKTVTSPEVQKAIAKAKATTQASSPAAPLPSIAPTSTNKPAPSARLDPELQKLADQLNSPDNSPQRDLEIVGEFLSLYARAFRSGYPTGLNEDITAALTGTANPDQPGFLFPKNSPHVRNGQLVDRWGTPLWFHPESGTKMEIRSAGPDKNLFTDDDVILNH